VSMEWLWAGLHQNVKCVTAGFLRERVHDRGWHGWILGKPTACRFVWELVTAGSRTTHVTAQSEASRDDVGV